ncbi:MAG: hypothetical protein ACMXYB_03935 [Candidatus Woesearchaeota archaeon]
MNALKINSSIFLLSLILILIPNSFSNFETISINLELIEGGCAGYDNSLVQVYYQNNSLVNNSDFIVEFYDGPLAAMGILLSFEVSSEPQKIDFQKPGSYLYDIRVPNDNNTYLQTSGFIDIFDCGFDSFNAIDSYESLIEIKSNFDPQIPILSVTQHRDESLETDFKIIILELNLMPFIRNSDRIKFNTDQQLWTSDNLENWEKINSSDYIFENLVSRNVSYIAVETLQTNQENTTSSNNNGDNQENGVNNSTVEEEIQNRPISRGGENVQELQTSSSTFSGQSSNSSFIVTFVVVSLLLGGIFFLIISKSSKKNSSQEYETSNSDISLNNPIPNLMESRIITYIETYKEYYSTEQIIDQLINNGFEKQTIIEIIQKYIEKQKNNKSLK